MIIKSLASSSKANCIYINDGSTPILLDCGLVISALRPALDFKVSEIEAVICTHGHMDHARGLKELAKLGVDCYLPQQARDMVYLDGHRIHVVGAMEVFRVGTWEILAFDAIHDVECLGYLLSSNHGYKVLYLVDSAYCKYKFQGLTHILTGCNYDIELLREGIASGTIPVAQKNRVMRSHSSLSTVIKFLLANDLSKVQEIWLLHLSDGNSNAAEFKRKIQETTGKVVYVA